MVQPVFLSVPGNEQLLNKYFLINWNQLLKHQSQQSLLWSFPQAVVVKDALCSFSIGFGCWLSFFSRSFYTSVSNRNSAHPLSTCRGLDTMCRAEHILSSIWHVFSSTESQRIQVIYPSVTAIFNKWFQPVYIFNLYLTFFILS